MPPTTATKPSWFNTTIPFLLSIPMVFYPSYPQLSTSKICSFVISCQKCPYQELAKMETLLFFSLKDCNVDLRLPNPGWFWTAFSPALCPAVATLTAGHGTVQGSEDLSLLPSCFIARSETLVHLLHSFGSSLQGFFFSFLEDKLLHGKKPKHMPSFFLD